MVRDESAQPHLGIRSLPIILAGVPLELVTIGVVLLALPPFHPASYMLRSNILLAVITLLLGLSGALALRLPPLVLAWGWFSLQPGTRPRRQGEVLIALASVIILLILTSVPYSSLTWGGLALMFLQSAQGMLWLQSLVYLMVKINQGVRRQPVTWFLLMWLGLSFGWLIAGFLAYAFGVTAMFFEAVLGFLVIAALYIVYEARTRRAVSARAHGLV